MSIVLPKIETNFDASLFSFEFRGWDSALKFSMKLAFVFNVGSFKKF